jgi:hypothetical protein
MPATLYAVIGRYEGSSIQAAFAQINPGNPQDLDLIHICDQGSVKAIINVDYTGAVHYPVLNPTSGVRIGKYFTRLSTTATLAQIFADAFSENVSLQDIIQCINLGGNISYYLNYQGVATGS